MNADAIWISCEGSGCPAHGFLFGIVKCAMCGAERFRQRDSDLMPNHQRKDILAMIDRGDFNV